MSVALYVEAKQTRDGAGQPIPPTAGSAPTADGIGGATWLPVLLAAGTAPMTGPLTLNTGAIAAGNQFTMLPMPGPTVTNTVAATSMLAGTGKGSLTLPANVYVAGSKIKIICTVNVLSSITGSSFIFQLKLGGVSVWTIFPFATGLRAAATSVKFEIVGTNGNGTTGTFSGTVVDGGAGPPTTTTVVVATGQAWNVSVANAVDFVVTANAADPSNQVRLTDFSIESFA